MIHKQYSNCNKKIFCIKEEILKHLLIEPFIFHFFLDIDFKDSKRFIMKKTPYLTMKFEYSDYTK